MEVFDPKRPMPPLGDHAGHFERVRTIIVTGLGKEPKLFDQRLVPSAELQRPGSNERLKTLDATNLVGRVRDLFDVEVNTGLLGSPLNLIRQERLELIGFEAELRVLPHTAVFDDIIDDSIGLAAGDVGIQDEHRAALGVPHDGDDGRVIGVPPLFPKTGIACAVVKQRGPDGCDQVLLRSPVIIPESKILFQEEAVLRIDRLVLLFGIETGSAFCFTHEHEPVIVFLLGPKDLGALEHLLLVALEESLRRFGAGGSLVVLMFVEDLRPRLP